MKVLLIHAGGQSQRMPSASVLGKVFSPIPKGNPMYQMLDIKLGMFWPLIDKMFPGVFVTCADDFLVYDLGEDFIQNNSIKFSKEGFTVLAHPSPVAIGTTHGVYVLQDPESINPSVKLQTCECSEVLQKPSEAVMKEKGAILNGNRSSSSDGLKESGEITYTDSSFYFGHDVTRKFLDYLEENGMVTCEIDAYGDFLQALGKNATSDYIENVSNVSIIIPTLRDTRMKMFKLLKGTDISVLVMSQSKFIHTGTVLEYIEYFCNDHTFQDELGLSKDIFNLWTDSTAESKLVSDQGLEPAMKKPKVSSLSDTSLGCVMHSVLPQSSNIQSNTVLEYCHFDVKVNIGQYCIVSNCEYLSRDSDSPNKQEVIDIPNNLFVHTIPICEESNTKYVTVFFDIKDNLKKTAQGNDIKSLPFLGKLVADYAKVVNIGLSGICPSAGDTGTKVNLWHSCLFPVCESMTESLGLALKCVNAVKMDSTKIVSLKEFQTISMFRILQVKDVSAMLKQRNIVYRKIKSANVS